MSAPVNSSSSHTGLVRLSLVQLSDYPDSNNRDSLTLNAGSRYALLEDGCGGVHVYDRERRMHMRIGSGLVRRVEYVGFDDPDAAPVAEPPPPAPAPAKPATQPQHNPKPWKR